jgi:hypothetical protein
VKLLLIPSDKDLKLLFSPRIAQTVCSLITDPRKFIIPHVVALSRAKEGLYILGNATNMASRSRMWQSVIEELEKQQAVGDAFPIACHQHPDSIEYVSRPGVLPRLAPDGMLPVSRLLFYLIFSVV